MVCSILERVSSRHRPSFSPEVRLSPAPQEWLDSLPWASKGKTNEIEHESLI